MRVGHVAEEPVHPFDGNCYMHTEAVQFGEIDFTYDQCIHWHLFQNHVDNPNDFDRGPV